MLFGRIKSPQLQPQLSCPRDTCLCLTHTPGAIESHPQRTGNSKAIIVLRFETVASPFWVGPGPIVRPRSIMSRVTNCGTACALCWKYNKWIICLINELLIFNGASQAAPTGNCQLPTGNCKQTNATESLFNSCTRYSLGSQNKKLGSTWPELDRELLCYVIKRCVSFRYNFNVASCKLFMRAFSRR